MSTSDNDKDKQLPTVEDEGLPKEPGQDLDDLDAVPVVTPEDMPGISVHDPGKEKGKFHFNPMRPFQRHVVKTRKLTARQKRNRTVRYATAGAVAVAVLAIGLPLLWLQLNKLPDVRKLESYVPVQAVRIYDRFDHLVASVAGDEDRRPIKLSQVSPDMKLAMVGAEDHDFYHHGGINPSSIMRAMIKNLQAGRIVEGGSTITQQLVKNLFFPGEKRTFNRKIKEFFLANDVDRKYPKDKILEMYLNQIYFGNQSYGIEAAAQRYFNKPAAKLNLGEATFLAGLVRSPSYLSNPEHRQEAFARQHQVIDQMLSYDMITPAQANSAKSTKLAFRKFVNPYQKYPYYISYIMDELRDHYGQQELQHGLNVYTYLDPQAQEAAEKAMSNGIAHAPAGITQGALVSLKVNDGGVIALVGGVGKFEDHQWNRAVSPHTMGSAFKPFVYLTGLIKGLTPESIIPDSPFSVPSGGHMYSPRNFDNSFMGPLTLKMALTQSRNVCAVRVAWFAGIKNVINVAHLAGLTSKLDPYMPTAIGACAASPLDMAGAYSTIARGGVYITPHLVRNISTPEGKHIYDYDEAPKKVFDSRAVAELVECMQNVVEHGTGIYGQLPGRPVAGKTGTADQSKDIWFCGFTPDVVTTTWGGNDTNRGIHNKAVTGGMVMAGMWKNYMMAYYNAHPTPPGSFLRPSDTAVAMSTDEAEQAKAKGIVPVNADINDQKAKAEPALKPGEETAKQNDNAEESANGVTEFDKTDKDHDATADSEDNTSPNRSRVKRYVARKEEAADAVEEVKPSAEPERVQETAPEPANDVASPRTEEHPVAAPPVVREEERAPAPAPAPAPVERARPAYVRMPNGQVYMVPQPMAAPAPRRAPVAAPAASAPEPVPAPAGSADDNQ